MAIVKLESIARQADHALHEIHLGVLGERHRGATRLAETAE
jgi:hypothetical protein